MSRRTLKQIIKAANKISETKIISVVTKPGTIGKDGKSAYDIAVDNGFIGTQQEWLDSLRGEDILDGGDMDGGSPETSAEDSVIINLGEI